jgi:hypothetical protein
LYKHMPELDQKLAGYGDNSGIAIAFAGKEFPAPFSQSGIPAHAHDRVRTLNEKVAHVATATLSDAEFDELSLPAFTLSRIEANVGHQLFGPVKASNVSDYREQGKGVDLADPEQSHAAQHQGLGANLLADELKEAVSLVSLGVKVLEVSSEQFLLQRRPIALCKDPFLGSFALKTPAAQTDGKLVEVAFKRVGCRSVGGNRILVSMEQFPAFTGHRVRHSGGNLSKPCLRQGKQKKIKGAQRKILHDYMPALLRELSFRYLALCPPSLPRGQ